MNPRPLGPAPEPDGAETWRVETEAEAVMSVEVLRRMEADRLRCLDDVQRITAGRDFDARDLVVLAHYVHTGEELPYLPLPRERWELG